MANKAASERNAATAASITNLVTDLETLIADIWKGECPDGSEYNELADALFATRDSLEELAVSVECGHLDACFPEEEICGRPAIEDVVCDDLVVGKTQAALRGEYDARTVSRDDVLPADNEDVDVVAKPRHKNKARAAKASK